jgi:predicted nucleic acid-binding protein
MRKIIIADASCLILLEKVGELNLLSRLSGEIVITPEISEEFNRPLPDWMEIKFPDNAKYQEILEVSLGKGEASALALAIEIPIYF